jgi:signal transduction histidine kinase
VGDGAVAYLAYDEQPGLQGRAAWDGRPVPAAPPPDGVLRGRPVFEVEVQVPVAAPGARRASLRVGLDAASLAAAPGAAAGRTAVVGAALAALGLLATAYAEVQRARTREREENRRRLSRLEEERRRSERLAAAGALAAGLAHEVRNPLNAIGLAAQRLARVAGAGEEGRVLAGRIRAEVGRLETTLKDLLDLGRPAGGERELHDLADLARDVVALLELEAAERRVRLVARLEPVAARVDREALRRALVNLVRNALEASPAGAQVEVAVGTLKSARTSGRLWARLAVRDSGSGIDPEFAERAFDAFVTTKAGGSGLGLALVRRVAEEHGGRASLRNHPEGGVEALLELPLEKERG